MPMSKTLGLSPWTRNADFSRRVTVHAAHRDGGPSAPHSAWNPHPMQGWSPDFIHLSAALLPTSRPTTDEELKIAASTPGGQLKAAGILERGPLKRAPRRQIIHDSAQPGVGFGLQAAVPGSSDKVVNLVIARAAQRPDQGFCLI